MKLKISLLFTLMMFILNSLSAQAIDTGKIEKMAVAGHQIIYIDKPIAIIDIGIGAGLIAMVYKRRTNAITYIQLGVTAFNK